jgi:diacylglycerol kinase (ATP)
MPSAADSADILLLFGGDGTMHRHLNQLVELGLPVLVVPTGSGNDFARALGLRRRSDSLAAWRKFCAGKENIRAIDLGTIAPYDSDAASLHSDSSPAHDARHYFCSVACVGLDAAVTRRANGLPRWLRGHGGYAWSAVRTIFQYEAGAAKISFAGERGGWTVRSHGKTVLAAFANTGIYGGGMKIAPAAKMDDGLLDVCVIGGMNRWRLAGLFPSVYFGVHLKIRAVDYFPAARLRIETESPLDLYADGEFVCRTPVEIGVKRGVLRVVSSIPGESVVGESMVGKTMLGKSRVGKSREGAWGRP